MAFVTRWRDLAVIVVSSDIQDYVARPLSGDTPMRCAECTATRVEDWLAASPIRQSCNVARAGGINRTRDTPTTYPANADLKTTSVYAHARAGESSGRLSQGEVITPRMPTADNGKSARGGKKRA